MSLAVLADHMASKGRNGDTMLVHMAPEEVAGLHALALSHGGYMTINPQTGLPEAFSLKGLLKSALPMIAGFALGPAGFGIVSSALGAGALVGGATALATGSLQKGLMAGLGAYGGANLGSALIGGSSAGASAAAAEAAAQEAAKITAANDLASAMGTEYVSQEATSKALQEAASKAYSNFAAKPLLEQATGSFTALKDAPGMFGGLGALARPALMAAAPIIADQAVQTATSMPAGQRYQGTIRPYRFDPFTRTWTAQPTYPAVPVNTAAEPNPQEQQPPGGYRGGGIVALANGGFTDERVAQALRESMGQGFTLEQSLGGAASRFGISQDQLTRAQALLNAPAAPAGLAALAPAPAPANLAAPIAPPTTITSTDPTQRATPNAAQLAAQQSILDDPHAAAVAAVRSGINAGMTNQQIADMVNMQYGKSFNAQNVADFMATNNLTRFQRQVDPVRPPVEPIVDPVRPPVDPVRPPVDDPYGPRTCPAPWMRVLLADGGFIEAGSLQPGMRVHTKHEHSMELGDFEVEAVSIAQDARLKITFDHVEFVGSPTHKFYKNDWVEAKELNVGDVIDGHTIQSIEDFGVGDVVVITIKDAHTYICEGLLSHNKTPTRPVVPPVVPPVVINDTATVPGSTGTDTVYGGDTVTPTYTAPQPDVTLGPAFQPTAPTMSEVISKYEQGGGSTRMPTITDIKPGERTYTLNAVADMITKFLQQNPNARYSEVQQFAQRNGIPEMQARAAYNEFRFSTMTGGTKNAYDYLMGRAPYSTRPFVPGGGPIAVPYAEAMGLTSSAMGRFRPTMPPSGSTTDRAAQGSTSTTGSTTSTTGSTTTQQTASERLRSTFDQSIFGKTPEEKAAYYNSLLGQGYTDEQIRAAINAPLDDNWLALRAIAERLRASTTGTTGDTTKTTGGNTSTSGNTLTSSGVTTLLGNAGTGSTSATSNTSTSTTPITDFLFGTQDADTVPVEDRSTYSTAAVDERINNFLNDRDRSFYYDYAAPSRSFDDMSPFARGGLADVAAMSAARGGNVQGYNLGGYSDGGRLLRGPGDGVSDSIPATIGNKQPARLADGEFVIPARIVSEIGNGSTEAGARKLYAMMDRVQRARAKTTGKGKVAKNTRAEKYLPA